MRDPTESTMQRNHRIVRKHQTISSARSLLTLAVSDALASCRQAVPPRRRDAPVVLAMTMMAALACAPAQANEWTGAVSSDWFTPANWSDGLPTDDTNVVIDATQHDPEISGGDASIRYFDIYAGALTISGGGTLSSSVGGIGGRESEAIVTVTGQGSRWSTTAFDVFVGAGFDGIGRLDIENGGVVEARRNVDIATGSGSVGQVTVEGAGSGLFAGGAIKVGTASQSKGTLVLQDGGQARSGSGTVGESADSVGEVTVTGADSSWSISHQLMVGNHGSGMLLVEAGGAIDSENGILGIGSLGEATVTGAGSSWTNSNDLSVGQAGTGTLLVEAGGTVSNQNGVIGNEAGSVGKATVTGTDSAWTNGKALSVGKGGEGTLEILDGGHVQSTSGSIGTENGSDGKVRVSGVDSAGTRSNWKIDGVSIDDGGLIVGDAGTGSLVVEAGGTVSSKAGVIGNEAGSVGKVTVTGAGSTWTNGGALTVGEEGQGLLQILDGGLVESASASINSGTLPDGGVEVIGSGSTWTNAGALLVGETSLGSMEVLFGGLVESASVSLGSTGSEGRVRVSGFDAANVSSRLGITGDLLVGDAGTGKLSVDNAGVLDNQDGTIGNTADSTDSRAQVTGTGSTWTNRGALSVGKGGEGILEVLDGGHVESASGSIGTAAGSDGKVRVSGVDSAGTYSSWEIDAGNLTVGDAGAGLLLVEAGGRVRNLHSFIGNEAGSVGEVTVTGEGSAWINDHGLWVGNAGSGVLEIRDGGVVGSVEGVVGNANAGDGAVLVDGAGSRWDIGGGLVVGNDGSGQVTLSNGGAMTSMYAAIGNQGQELGTVLVQGAGSAWTGLQGLYLGLQGNGALTLAEGGRVEVMAGIPGAGVVLGGYAGSSGTLNIGAGGAAGVFDAASITSGDGIATLNFNHDDANYFFSNDGTASGTAVLIDGTTTVNQIGTGTTVLTGAHTYTGATNVNAGTLLVEGSLGATATTARDGGTLGGSGSIGGDVTIADGGILAPGSSAGTLTVGSLTLEEGATLDYELGRAGVIGDDVNDLVEVTGNLTLDGTLDITDIGGFGAGVYRLMNYGGDLTDNGLEFGVLPGASDAQDLFVQTAIGGQVNLVNSAGLTLSFWDGSVASEHNNDAIDDGDGMWNAGNDNWTASDGTLNGRWHDGTFAVFGGTAGNVEVVGEQAIAGLQFMSGYTLTAGTDGALRIDGADSVIRVDPDVTATIAVALTGAGCLVKTDTGTLVLSGANSYEGGTRIDLGTLQVASDDNLGDAAGGLSFDGGTLQTTTAFVSARDVNIGAGGGTFQTDADLGLGGVVSGAGTLTKDGDGTLTLAGENTYTGDTRVLDGTLVGDTGSIRGNLANDGTVVFDQVDDVTFAGAIAGSGTMAKRGDGALTLTGNSALDWSIDAGALASRSPLFTGDANIADGALLRFDEQGDGRYGGKLSGTGAFEIAGDGIFALTGDSAGFTGTTSLESGTLQLGGALGGNTLVANGAWLTGIGTLGSVDNHGTIAPGNSIGTLTLTGNYLHHDDATLLAEIEPGGDSDLLDIAGSATIEGGTVEIVKLPGQYEGGTRYTLIDAAGGVTGNFDTLDQDLPFLDLLLGYDANHVYLDVQRNEVDFNIVCGTGSFNQCQVAGALDAIGHDHPVPDDLKTVLTEVTSLTLPGAQAAFDTLSGEAHASAAGAMLEGHALYGQTVTRRLAERREAVGAQRLQGGAWARGYGMGSELDGDGNAHGARLELYGLAVGVDAWASESWLIGASVNTLKLDADFRAGDGAEADAKNVSLYTSVQGERGYLDAVASFAWWNSEVQRRIAVGSLAREARSDYGMDRIALALEAGLTYDLGNSTLQPLLSVEFNKLSTEGFREDGADEVNLIGRSQDVERTVAGAGVRWTGEFSAGTWTFAPTAQARWLHTFGDLDAEFAVAFAGAPDTSFRVRGVTVPEDRGLVGIGLQASRDTLDVFADVDYQAGDGFKSASFGAGLRWRW
jgi:T5SS/PEP-CTERM-associated repeat protein/autotransporter-associated beta strand protein